MDYPAGLTSPILKETAATCQLTFSYRHLNPDNIKATLTVNLYRHRIQGSFLKPLLTIEDKTNWKNYTVNIGQLSAGYQILITGNSTATLLLRPYIDMCLDQIIFYGCDANTIPVTPVIDENTVPCNFEEGTCGWFDWNAGAEKKLDWVLFYNAKFNLFFLIWM